jgi:hypothetical protein
MVNLQIGLVHFFQVDEALAAIFLNELIFDLLGKTGAAAKPSELLLLRIGKPVGRNLPAIGRFDPKGLELNAQFPNIPCRSRRMIVTIFALQLFRSDVAVLENVVYHGLGTLARDGRAQIKEVF